MITVFYEGFAFSVFPSSTQKGYWYSQITLEFSPTFHFWEYDVHQSSSWSQCLFDSIKMCQCIISDYGFSPVGFDSTLDIFETSSDEF